MIGKAHKERPLLEAVDASNGDSKFARALGSVDHTTRERGLQAMTIWLSKKPDLGEKDVLKLWKGIFYCFWHSDKEPVQVGDAMHMHAVMEDHCRTPPPLPPPTTSTACMRRWRWQSDWQKC
jgi:ribosomal RNA-processing protein 1